MWKETISSPNPENPFAYSFPEIVNINGLLESELHDFVGVKIGDVNGSAVANNLLGGDDRSVTDELIFTTENKAVRNGETFDVSFTSDNFNEIFGYQYTLNYDVNKLELVDITAEGLPQLSDCKLWIKLIERRCHHYQLASERS